jgi:hypothetical protein
MTTSRQFARWAAYILVSALAINCASGDENGVTQEPAPTEPADAAPTPTADAAAPAVDAAAPAVDAAAPAVDAGPAPGATGSTCHTDADCDSGRCSGLWTSYPLNGFCD